MRITSSVSASVNALPAGSSTIRPNRRMRRRSARGRRSAAAVSSSAARAIAASGAGPSLPADRPTVRGSYPPMPTSPALLQTIIDLDRYPVLYIDAAHSVIAAARAQLADTGAAELPGFI